MLSSSFLHSTLTPTLPCNIVRPLANRSPFSFLTQAQEADHWQPELSTTPNKQPPKQQKLQQQPSTVPSAAYRHPGFVAKLSKWGEGYFFTQRGAQRFLAEVSRIGINAHSDMWIMKNLDPVRWELKYTFVQDRQVGDMPESSAAGLHKNRRTNSTLKNARLAIMGDSHALFAGPRLGDLSANHPQEQHFPKASDGRLLDLLLQPSFPRQSSGSGSSSSVKAGNMTRTDQTAETTETQATTQTMQGIFLSRADVNFTQVVERWRKREADMLPSDTLHTFVFTSTPVNANTYFNPSTFSGEPACLTA